jgi:hypothetical protein
LYHSQDTHFPDEETPETTTEIGLKLVKQLKNSKDKTYVLPSQDQDQCFGLRSSRCRAHRRANADGSLDRGRNVAGHFLQLPDEVLTYAEPNV